MRAVCITLSHVYTIQLIFNDLSYRISQGKNKDNEAVIAAWQAKEYLWNVHTQSYENMKNGGN